MTEERSWRDERRRHPRRVYKGAQILCTSVDFSKGENPYNFATHLVDIGLGGACILSVGKLRPGVRMMIDIHFPAHQGNLKGPARVVWSSDVDYRGRTLFMTGLQFEGRPELSPHALDAIQGREVKSRPGQQRGTRVERRRAPRAKVIASDVVVTPAGLLSGLGLSRNVARTLVDMSRNGAQFSTTREMSAGEEVVIRVRIPKFGDIFTARGRVKWCRPDTFTTTTERYFVGMVFDEVPPEGETILRALERWYDSEK